MYKFLGILFIIGSLLITSPLSMAEDDPDDATFKELVVTSSADHLLLFGLITNSFNPEMTARLRSGIPIDFSFFLELKRLVSDNTWQLITTSTFRHTLSYDTLKDQYLVKLGEFADRTFSFKEITKAQTEMSQINGAKIIPLGSLLPDSTYRLRVKADLFEQTLPLSLHHIIPFVSWWDRETDWQTLDFNY